MRAVLLAGGDCKALRPITYELPQVLIPFQKRKIMDIPLDLLYKYNVFEVWLTVSKHGGNKILEEYKYPYFAEREPLGTGAFLRTIKSSPVTLNLFQQDPFFIVANATNLFNLDLREMVALHLEKKATVTIACTKVKDVSKYGSVHINKQNVIESFEEKERSRQRKSGWVNGGFYLFSKNIFDVIEPNKLEKNDLKLSLEKELFPELVKTQQVIGYKSSADWHDTSSFKSISKAYKEWKGIR